MWGIIPNTPSGVKVGFDAEAVAWNRVVSLRAGYGDYDRPYRKQRITPTKTAPRTRSYLYAV
jgi:hypothetical protein